MNCFMYQGFTNSWFKFSFYNTPNDIETARNLNNGRYSIFNIDRNSPAVQIKLSEVFMNKYEMILGTARSYMMLAKATKSQVYVLAGIKCLMQIVNRENTKTMEMQNVSCTKQ